METVSEAQRQKEETEIRERDLRRQKEKEELQRRLAEEQAAEERRRQDEEQRRVEEERRRKRLEEEWKKLGPDIIQELPPVPPALADDQHPNTLEAWYLDDETSMPTLCTHSLKPGRRPQTDPVTLRELREIGIIVFVVNLNDFTLVRQILKERNYKHTDEIRISQTAKDDGFLERWYKEHFNDDEQLRLVTDGSLYVDVRSRQDKWIRCHVKAGHLIVIPAGIYHRATLDEDDYTSLFRGFQDAPRFIPIFRSDGRAESHNVRLNYLLKLKKGDVATELGFK